MSNYKLTVHQDTDIEDPRETCDNVGTMICFHRRYRLGDKHSFGNDYEAFLQEAKTEKYILLALYLYDHSGLSINTTGFGHAHHGSWDSMQVGWIFCSREKAAEEWGKKYCTKRVVEKAKSYMVCEVSAYDKYLRGESYYYEIEHPDGESECSGTYDDYNECEAAGELRLAELKNTYLGKLTDIVLTRVEKNDHPDYCDAYIESAKVDGRQLTEEELEDINDNHLDFINQQALEAVQ